MISITTTAIAPFLLLGIATVSLMQYELELPPFLSLTLVGPALLLGGVVAYSISVVVGVPLWAVTIGFVVAIAGFTFWSAL